MAVRAKKAPAYRHYKPKDLAVVRIEGKDHYLGRYGSPESWEKYHRLLAEHHAGSEPAPPPTETVRPITIVEVVARYMRHCRRYYRKNGQQTETVDQVARALRTVRRLYGRVPAADFGPLALKLCRQDMLDTGRLCRKTINERIEWTRAMFKWAASEELLPVTVYQALATVDGLRKGRTTAPERPPVEPVADEVVDATIPELPTIVADMVRLQRLTGARPEEITILRPMDLDRSGPVWEYRPGHHKTEHQGRQRVVMVGPKAQAVLMPYLLRPADSFCFSPIESEAKRREELHQQRKTPLSCGNRPGTNRRRKPRKEPGDHYDTASYRRAIHRAVARINAERRKQDPEAELLPKWSPNRLRHTAATEVRRKYGLEAAQAVLGHAQADVTQLYAERDLDFARRVIGEVG